MRNDLSASRILEQVQLLERQFTASRQNETGGKFILSLGTAVDFFIERLMRLKKARDRARRTANNGIVMFVFPLEDNAHCF
jgi:hypothetical protein